MSAVPKAAEARIAARIAGRAEQSATFRTWGETFVPAGGVVGRHPLEESDRLAWQATAAVGLLERFGDLVTIALDAVGGGDDAALREALAERERVMARLEPLLADLAAARASAADLAGGPSQRAIATILRPVDEALRYAQLLHIRLTDEVEPEPSPTATIALVR